MLDIVMRVTSVPTRGADALASQRLLSVGGGYNSMSAAARQGMAVVYAGRLGTGPFSSMASDALGSDGIEIPIEPDEGSDVGFCVVLVDDGAERTFITSPGAEATLRPSDLDVLGPRPGDFVIVSGYNVMYPETAPMVLSWLSALPDDVAVAFDPSNRVMDIPVHYLERALARATWLFCNETEAAWMTGESSLERSVVALAVRTGGSSVVLRHGATGCTIVEGGSVPVAVPGFETTVVDTNGAGDTHAGVFLAELARGSNVLDAARRANAAASMSISVLGPATSPRRAAVSDRLRESR